MSGYLKVSAFLVLVLTLATSVQAEQFREGRIAALRANGQWSYAFAFVGCKGKLMLSFNADRKLNRFRVQKDGGLFVKFNGNKYQHTFYDNGTLKMRNGELRQWRYATAAELASLPANQMAVAKAKCS